MMLKRIFAPLFFAVFIICVTGSIGQEKRETQSAESITKSWSRYQLNLTTRITNMNDKRPAGSHAWAEVELLTDDLIRSESLIHSTVGIVEIQLRFGENRQIEREIPNGKSWKTLHRIVSYRLRFMPAKGTWSFADGTATMIWSVDDDNDYAGERAKVDLQSPSDRFGMDLIVQLVADNNR